MAQMQIDYNKLGVLLLPTILRGGALQAIVQVCILPLSTLHDTHQTQRATRMFELQHTSSICHIKDALNREFMVGNYAAGGSYADGFEIEDINAIGNYLMTYDETEAFADVHAIVPDAPRSAPVYDEEAISQTTSSFIVYVPRRQWSELLRIKSIVEQYRLASRIPTYMIKP